MDDEGAICDLFREILTGSGYEVALAGDGKRALEALATSEFDLMITDLVMPDQEGIETIRAVRRAQPKLKVIAVSGCLEVQC